MTVEEFRHLTVVQSVLLRPRMYTVTGSFRELLAFFNGCLNPGLNETRDDDSVGSMFQWLKTELRIDSKFVLPERIYNAAIAHFGDEASVIQAIHKQFLDSSDITDPGS